MANIMNTIHLLSFLCLKFIMKVVVKKSVCFTCENITNVSKASRKMFTIYVSIYTTQLPFTAQICGEDVDYIR